MRPRSPLAVSLFLFVGIVAIIYFVVQRQSQISDFQRLLKDGRPIQARIIDLQQSSSRRGIRYLVSYDFQIDAGAYQGSARIDSREFQAFKIGAQIPVTYLASNPTISTLNPSAQIKTAHVEQTFNILGGLLFTSLLAYAVRQGIANGWTCSDV